MCLIAVKEKGVAFPKDEYMLHAEKRNNDGIGIMYWKPDTTEVHIKKDFLNAKHMLFWCKTNLTINDAVVIHFRLATHGLKDIGNRHPFPITKNVELLRKPELVCQLAVAHNGVISEYHNHHKFSDTQKFVLDILSDESIKNNLKSEAVKKLIESFISGDKLAILGIDGEIQRFGNWETEDNIYYSNSFYKPFISNYGQGLLNRWREDYDEDWNLKDNTNSSMGKIIPNNNVHVFKSICEGCNEEKYVMMVEIEGKDNIILSFNLCKKCRKDLRKGNLQLISDIEGEMICDSCGEFFPEKELIDIQFEGISKVCEKCHKDIIESGWGVSNK